GQEVMEEKSASPMFKKYAEKYLESPHLSASTVRGYNSILKVHILPVFKSKALDEITREDIKDLAFGKLKGGLSKSRTVQMVMVLSGLFSEAMEDRHVDRNPASKLTKLLNNKKDALKDGDTIEEEVFPFSPDELRAHQVMCKELYPDHPYATYFLTLARTGVRTSEGIGLKAEDIDFDAMTIHIRRAIVEGELTTPKDGESRKVEMTPQLTEVLQGHIRAHPGEWLFTNGAGNPLDDGRLRRVHYKVCKEAELENGKKRGIHQIRHSYATNRLGLGHDIADVSKQLGHKDIGLTYKYYYDWVPKKNNRQVDALDDPKNAPYVHPTAPQEKRVSEYVH
ncbi:MAG: site-specific integrase, partial [Desulfatiglandales bacterium]|nr:site-specific integrase [Desulfatiglandales bacterium]